ncbi:hypothetical protein KDA_09860 [Dictyobacter alpinus]|uniref:Uncharacterized protein n=1 Tax=Dictyobacter alpinus TaxID=2014873 RepID=A0A402B2C5_9CHLR|nr:hypothetical protein [Dictyobacter alpinus]GCE25502.1 hypothetical protein KDA_09860 [Dictyobacter alpinus]
MASVLILAMCAFPTSFETLWQEATFCGVVLIITASLIFWQKRSLKQFGYALLIGSTLVGGIWSFVLASVTSRNYLICAGVPGAGADLVRRADESYHTLLVFEAVVGATCIMTLILVLISVFSLYFAYRRREALILMTD